MATTIGHEDDLRDLVTNLILLERDAIAAYESTISRLSEPDLSAQVKAFRQDHLQHLDVLTRIAAETGADAPAEGDMKQLLTTGKVALAGLLGDATILKAMRTNEEDTVTAYERASGRADLRPETKAFFEKAWADERRHRDWMVQTAERL